MATKVLDVFDTAQHAGQSWIFADFGWSAGQTGDWSLAGPLTLAAFAAFARDFVTLHDATAERAQLRSFDALDGT